MNIELGVKKHIYPVYTAITNAFMQSPLGSVTRSVKRYIGQDPQRQKRYEQICSILQITPPILLLIFQKNIVFSAISALLGFAVRHEFDKPDLFAPPENTTHPSPQFRGRHGANEFAEASDSSISESENIEQPSQDFLTQKEKTLLVGWSIFLLSRFLIHTYAAFFFTGILFHSAIRTYGAKISNALYKQRTF